MTVSKIQRLIDKVSRGEPAIGWKELGDMVRAAQGSDMAVFARIENDPWHSADDPGVASRVARALAIGVDGVKVNVYSKNEARWAVDAGAGWHARPHLAKFVNEQGSTTEQFKRHEAERAAGTLIIPSVESKLAIDQVDEILDIPGMRAFGIAMTDTAIALGHPMDYDHSDVWNFVDKVAAKAKARGIYLTAGTGYADRTWDGIAARVRLLHDHGIDMIFLQSPEYLFQLATTELLGKIRDALRR